MYTFLQSSIGGVLSTFIFIFGGHILDSVINPKYANYIALLISAFFDFIMQLWTFTHKTQISNHIIAKYIISEVLITTLTQLSIIYLIDYKKYYIKKVPKIILSYYTTFSRIIVTAILFVFVTFPLRKFWIFT